MSRAFNEEENDRSRKKRTKEKNKRQLVPYSEMGITWISFSLHGGWLISPASSTWFAIACSNSG